MMKTVESYGVVVFAGGQCLLKKMGYTKERAMEVIKNNAKCNCFLYECYSDGTCRKIA